MFEDFSFSSPSSTRPARVTLDADDRVMLDCDSALVSPLSSRCPSPKSSRRLSRPSSRPRSLFLRSPPAPTSVPFSYEDRRFSIGTLTQKLHEHTLKSAPGEEAPEEPPASPLPLLASDSSVGPTVFPVYYLTPPDTDHDDEGYGDLSAVTSPSTSSIPDWMVPYYGRTSVPLLDDTCPLDEVSNLRTQRQRFAREQCNTAPGVEYVRRAFLTADEGLALDPFGEMDCHPSSLPPQVSPRRRALTVTRSRFRTLGGSGRSCDQQAGGDLRDRRKSVSSVMPSHRIEKNYYASLSGRELRKRSEHELRRKSLMSAALASVTEKSVR